ncbi:MAG: YqaJ viral recombinase family protein [Exiguobacterium sp.]|nr:YqaJ viral recombinase family protein [Exiguobacterium sp.]
MTSKKYHLTKTKVANVREDIENRNGYIGGSDIGTIMGVNQWKSPYTLWAEKTGLIEVEDISDKDAVWFGVMEEDIIAKRFMMKTELKVKKSNYAYGCKEYPYLRGHVDRIAAKGKWGLEIKTTSSWNKTKYDEGEIPESHYWQCMFYMFLTGWDTWYLATKRDNRFYITKISRDDEAIERMLDACEDFWNHVQSGEPVEIDGSDSTQSTLEQMYPEEHQGETVNLDSQEETLIALLELATHEKNMKELKTKYQNEIKAVLGEAERGETGQFTVSWKANAKGTRVFRLVEKPL